MEQDVCYRDALPHTLGEIDHDIREVPGILIELQFHIALFVNLEPTGGIERTAILLVFTDDNLHC